MRRGFGARSVLVTALVAAFVTAACGPQPTSPAGGATQPSTAFLARHKPMNGGPAAIVSGTLVERDGCLAGPIPERCRTPTYLMVNDLERIVLEE